MWGTLLALGGLMAAAGAWLYLWRLSHELATAQRRLDRYNRALFDVNERIQALEERHAAEQAQLQAQIRWLTGRARFTPEMTVREAQALHPQAPEILAAFHLGGCSGCAVDPDERLDQVARRNGLDVQELLAQLNQLLPPEAAPGNAVPLQPQGPQRVKLPNVTLELE